MPEIFLNLNMATFLSSRILLPLLIETGSVTFVVLGVSLPILHTTQPDSYQLSNSTVSDQGTSPNHVSTVGNPNSSGRPPSYVGRLQPRDFYSGESANVSRLLDSLLRGYDKRLRPNYNGAPVEVGITMFVSTVSSVSEVNMDFTLDFYFRQHWRDARLQFTDEEDELCISNEMLDRIWWPDTFFANAKMAHFHTATTHNAFLRIKPSGWITQSLRLTVTSMCSMDLTYFPMDTQVCNLEIESYAYSVKHIIYTWKDGQRDSVGIERTLQLPQFRVRGYRPDHKLQVLSTGNYSRLFCEFYLARSLGYYVIHIYVPSCLIVVLSWISFWLHRDASPARVALGITTVLTMTTLISSSNASLPKISYLKSIDVYLVTCFVMVFASLLEYACVSYLSNRKWLPPPLPKRRNSDGPALFEAGSDLVVKPPSRMLKLNNRRTGCSNGPVINKSYTGSSDGDVTPSTNLPALPFPASYSPTKCNQHTPLSCRPTSLLTSGPAPTSLLTSGPAPTSLLTSDQACPALSSRHCLPQRNFSALRCCSAFESEMKRPPASVVGGADRVRCPPASVVGGNPYVILACNIDTYSRAMFPLAFFVFNLLYWIIFLHISSDRLGPDVVPI